jgi:dipeptidyl aminopeptidase/acylaminoacyl peptidase
MEILAIASLSLAAAQADGARPDDGQQQMLIPREVLFGNPTRTGVQISPDGSKLSYLAPVDDVLNVWVMPVDQGEPRPVTRSTDRPIRSYSWAQNGEQILYTNDADGDENTHVYAIDLVGGKPNDLTQGENVKANLLAQHRDRPDEVLIMSNSRSPEVFDVYRVNTRNGESSMIFQNDGGYIGMIPDDDWTIRVRGRMTADGGSDFDYRATEQSEWQDFESIGSEDSMTTQPMGFSRDGTTLWMADSRGRDTAALIAVNPESDGSAQRRIVFESDVSDIADAIMNPDTLVPQAIATERLRRHWHILDESIKPDLEALAELSDGELELVSRSRDDRTWVVAYEHDDGPTRYWLWDRNGQQGRYLFSHRPELEQVKLSHMRALEIPTRDGMSMPSYLTIPHNSDGKNLPLILLPHGGPWARDNWGYNPIHQWLADRGYAVLSPNFRGSTGFGKDYLNAGNRQWYGAMQDDLVDAVQWAIDEGIADPDRVAIMGGSYGGYATLAGMTRDPELFACGVDIVGPSHVGTLLETIPPYWEPIKVMFETRVGSLSEPEYLDSISPLTHVDNIRSPLLIGQGANDPRVKISESDQIVEAMDEKGIAVTYVVFPDEGHGFARPENMTAFTAITEAFLAEHLGGQLEPLTDEIPQSTAQLRRLGNLDLAGVAQWDPTSETEDKTVVAFEDLSPDQQQHVTQALEQIDAMRAQIKAEQGDNFDDAQFMGMILMQMRANSGQVPEEDRNAFNYLMKSLEDRAAGD